MSLFICKNCGHIENIDQIAKTDNKGYPNMTAMEMMGNYRDNNILMLCSECNTGKWHNEFDKKLPTEIEKEYSKLSAFSMVTKFDHPFSFETFENIYASKRKDYFQETITWAIENNKEIIYDSEKDELYEKEEYNKKQILKKIGADSMLAGIDAMTGGYLSNMITKDTKPHWKETQSESDKLKRLRMAEIKRLIKLNKKTKGSNVKELESLTEELRKLREN